MYSTMSTVYNTSVAAGEINMWFDLFVCCLNNQLHAVDPRPKQYNTENGAMFLQLDESF
jgi:hypothetical protein